MFRYPIIFKNQWLLATMYTYPLHVEPCTIRNVDLNVGLLAVLTNDICCFMFGWLVMFGCPWITPHWSICSSTHSSI